MSQKSKFIFYTPLIMAVMPILGIFSLYLTAFLPIPGLGHLALIYQPVFGPANIILEAFRYIIPGFQISGDLPPIRFMLMFLIWSIIGVIYGIILYVIQKRFNEQPTFGVKIFFVVVLSQFVFAYPLTYLIAQILRPVFSR